MITYGNELRCGGLKYPSDEIDYIEGTRYLHDDFTTGSIHYEDSLQLAEIPLRLNLHNDALEFLHNDSAYVFAETYRIDKILIGDDEFAYLKVRPNSEVSCYVKVWNNEFPMLITKMRIDFVKEIKGKPFVIPQPDHFERDDDTHYVMKSANDIERVKSLKQLINYLGTHRQKLSDLAKEEKISVKDAEELAKLLDYFLELEQNL